MVRHRANAVIEHGPWEGGTRGKGGRYRPRVQAARLGMGRCLGELTILVLAVSQLWLSKSMLVKDLSLSKEEKPFDVFYVTDRDIIQPFEECVTIKVADSSH